VFSIALVAGQAPSREWLVYAHAPLGVQKGVNITVPGFGAVKTDVSVGGTFVIVNEKTHDTRPL
jgi:proline racemase